MSNDIETLWVTVRELQPEIDVLEEHIERLKTRADANANIREKIGFTVDELKARIQANRKWADDADKDFSKIQKRLDGLRDDMAETRGDFTDLIKYTLRIEANEERLDQLERFYPGPEVGQVPPQETPKGWWWCNICHKEIPNGGVHGSVEWGRYHVPGLAKTGHAVEWRAQSDPPEDKP